MVFKSQDANFSQILVVPNCVNNMNFVFMVKSGKQSGGVDSNFVENITTSIKQLEKTDYEQKQEIWIPAFKTHKQTPQINSLRGLEVDEG